MLNLSVVTFIIMMENDQKQKEKDFQSFFTANFPKVKKFARRLLKSDEDAEDVAQDVFCKLWQQPEIWQTPNDRLDGYIFVTTRNIILNMFKHQRIEQGYEVDFVENAILCEIIEDDQVLKNIYYKELLMILRLALAKMPERRRMIFEASRFQGLSHKDIAEKLGVSIRTVEHQVYLALIDLKKILLFLVFLLASLSSTLIFVVLLNIRPK